jgi:mannose/fructose/N-acetylgalactosamine-specific phosphotransferase system component IIC
MIPLPKPRGFWDYALFALIMTGALLFLFWLEASDGAGWPDAALAGVAATLFVFATILARRGEKARWIAHPTWHAYLLVSLGAFAFIYADAFLLHRTDLTSNRLRRDIVPAVLLPAAFLWSLRRRFCAKRQVL